MGPLLHISWMSYFICGDHTEAAYSGFPLILGQAKAYNDPPVIVFTTLSGRLWRILRSLCPRIRSGFWTLATCQLSLFWIEVLVGPRWWVWCCMVHSEGLLIVLLLFSGLLLSELRWIRPSMEFAKCLVNWRSSWKVISRSFSEVTWWRSIRLSPDPIW